MKTIYECISKGEVFESPHVCKLRKKNAHCVDCINCPGPIKRTIHENQPQEKKYNIEPDPKKQNSFTLTCSSCKAPITITSKTGLCFKCSHAEANKKMNEIVGKCKIDGCGQPIKRRNKTGYCRKCKTKLTTKNKKTITQENQSSMSIKTENKTRSQVICLDCGKPLSARFNGKNKTGRCYSCAPKFNNKERAEKIKARRQKSLTLDFSDHPHILAKIKNTARREFRTPEKQALYELSTHYS